MYSTFISNKLLGVCAGIVYCSKYITANVLKGDMEPLQKEKHFYESFGFVEYDNSIFEAGVPACMLRLEPNNEVKN